MEILPLAQTSPGRSGNSKSAKRREAFLEEAGDLFLRNGFDNVTIDAIIARSGGSKASIYREFGSKEALFSEAIRQRCERTLRPIMQPASTSEDPAVTLSSFGVTFLKCVLSDDGILIHRIVLAEARRFPEVGHVFYSAGPRSVYRALWTIFLHLEEQSRTPAGSAERLARLFHGMILTELQLGRLLADAPMPDDACLHGHVEAAVRALLREA
ncbi:TetR/AcrR family transcriptional regulator [Antarcticirhabdus aurantiaca]|uniref:TetR/AcrR family transcriptional regulator n=1 Tax=Antarcticirhabdus aurantiaca TaxID=2606717 RepID=UPI00131B83D1|nr:TetR/AcrR family transcriptional regulator [Antarcticirhabdus aurantiaca]